MFKLIKTSHSYFLS